MEREKLEQIASDLHANAEAARKEFETRQSQIEAERQNLIDQAKSRIASGFYDNENVTDTTIDKLAHELSA